MTPDDAMPRLFRRRRGESVIWYIRDGAVCRTTGCREPELAKAEEELQRYKSHGRGAFILPGDPNLARISQLVANVVNAAAMDRDQGVMTNKNYNNVKYMVTTLLLFWNDLSISDFNQKNIDEYITQRVGGIGVFHGKNSVSETTARAC